MLSKINPASFICAHWRSFTDYATGKPNIPEIALHAVLPLAAASTYACVGAGITENAVGIIVSAASIAAGLLLNLLVLVYTLVYNAKSAREPISNLRDFQQVCDESLATIAYSILLCLCLVLASFISLAQHSALVMVGQFLTLALATSTILCLLIVVKRCYSLVHFDLKRDL